VRSCLTGAQSDPLVRWEGEAATGSRWTPKRWAGRPLGPAWGGASRWAGGSGAGRRQGQPEEEDQRQALRAWPALPEYKQSPFVVSCRHRVCPFLCVLIEPKSNQLTRHVNASTLPVFNFHTPCHASFLAILHLSPSINSMFTSSLPSNPRRHASKPPADAIRIAHHRWPTPQTRATSSCQAKRHPCMLPRRLFGSSCFDGLPLLFIGVVKPFSYALLSSFRPELPLFCRLSCSYLASRHQTSRFSFRLCARRRALSYNIISASALDTNLHFPTTPHGSVASKNPHSPNRFFPFS